MAGRQMQITNRPSPCSLGSRGNTSSFAQGISLSKLVLSLPPLCQSVKTKQAPCRLYNSGKLPRTRVISLKGGPRPQCPGRPEVREVCFSSPDLGGPQHGGTRRPGRRSRATPCFSLDRPDTLVSAVLGGSPAPGTEFA